jgi:hypothetical protein
MNPGSQVPDLLNELLEFRLRYHSFDGSKAIDLETQNQAGANSEIVVIGNAFGHPIKLGKAPGQDAMANVHAAAEHGLEAVLSNSKCRQSRDSEKRVRKRPDDWQMSGQLWSECVCIKMKVGGIRHADVGTDSEPTVEASGQGSGPAVPVYGGTPKRVSTGYGYC